MRQHRRSRHGFLAIGHSFGNKFIGHFFVPQGGVGVGVGCARGEEEEQLEELAVGRGHRWAIIFGLLRGEMAEP